MAILPVLSIMYVGAACAAIVASEPSKYLRTSDLEYQKNINKREHVIRRLYGDDNAIVRKTMNEIELRMARYSTGYNGDPYHIVPYENHPYDRSARRRRLEDQEDAANSTSAPTTTATYKPMRIRFETKALDDIRDSTNAAKIDWFKTEILQATAAFWSSALYGLQL